MARKPMITRTVKATEVKVLIAKVSDRTTTEGFIVLAGEYKKDDDILKYLKKNYDTPDTKHIAIISKNVTETLYGMSIEEFMKHAKVLTER